MVKKYYNDDIDVTVRYNVPVFETDLIKKLVKRVDNEVYAKVSIDHLNVFRQTTWTGCAQKSMQSNC